MSLKELIEMPRKKIFNYVLPLMLGIFGIVLTAWSIDLSVTAMVWGKPLTNGWITRNPQIVYHVALYCQLIYNFLITIALLLMIVKDKEF